MNVVKIKKIDTDYDMVKGYDSEEIYYLSKKRFKKMKYNKDFVKGFFRFKKGKSDERIEIEEHSFDLITEKPPLSFTRGYVRSETGEYYALITRSILPILLIIIMLLGLMGIFKICHIDTQIQKAPWVPTIDHSINAEKEKPIEQKSHKTITFHGFTDWTVNAGETQNLPISLQNPAGNPCYFTFAISLDDGTQLYKSDHVPPDKEIRKIDILQPLDKGVYTAFIKVTTNALETGASMNSARMKITIKAI